MVETLCSSTDYSLQRGAEVVEWCGARKEVLVPAVLHSLPKKCSKKQFMGLLVCIEIAYAVIFFGYLQLCVCVCVSSMSLQTI